VHHPEAQGGVSIAFGSFFLVAETKGEEILVGFDFPA